MFEPIKFFLRRSIYNKKNKEKIETVLIQDHFYSYYLLFALANKTITQSRMIKRTLLFLNGISKSWMISLVQTFGNICAFYDDRPLLI